MSIYKLAQGLSFHVIFYQLYNYDFTSEVLPAFEKAVLKLTFYLNCADHETTDKRKRKYYRKAWKSVIKVETYYNLIENQDFDFGEHLIEKYIAKIKRVLKKELSEQ